MRFLWILLLPLRVLLALVRRPFRMRARRRILKEHGWVEVHLEGAIQEFRARSKLPPFVRRLLRREEEPRVVLWRLQKLADEMISDPYAKGLLVRIASMGGGYASAMRVREQLLRIRGAGKQIIAHIAEHATNREMLIATAADRVLMTPSGGLASVGAAASTLFLKDTLAKGGVQFEVASRGRYKAAPEALTRSTRSEFDLEQTKALVDEIDTVLVESIAFNRRSGLEFAREMIDRCPVVGTTAVEKKYVDGLARDEDLPELIDREKPPELVGAGTYLHFRDVPPLFARKKKRVGIVEVHGAIVDRGSPYAPYFGKLAVERAVVNDLRAALEAPEIHAVVLHVDSRGGSVTASDAIYSAVRRLAKEKPVIACFGDVSASGGYYVACGARAIVCSPMTVTGSIGVFAMYPTWPELGRRIAVHHDVVKNRKNAALYDPWRDLDDDARAHADGEVGAMYESFLAIVAEARKKTRDQIHAVAEGRVWMGKVAHERGLVDGLGGMGEAIQRAKESVEGRFHDEPVLVRSRRYHPRPDPFKPEDEEKKSARGLLAELIEGASAGESRNEALGMLAELIGGASPVALELAALALTTSTRRVPLFAYAPIEVT